MRKTWREVVNTEQVMSLDDPSTVSAINEQLEQAVQVFDHLDDLRLPRDKIDCLLETARILYHIIVLCDKVPMKEFLSLFILVIIRTRTSLHCNIQFIHSFANCHEFTPMAEYIINQLTSALKFMKSAEFRSLYEPSLQLPLSMQESPIQALIRSSMNDMERMSVPFAESLSARTSRRRRPSLLSTPDVSQVSIMAQSAPDPTPRTGTLPKSKTEGDVMTSSRNDLMEEWRDAVQPDEIFFPRAQVQIAHIPASMEEVAVSPPQLVIILSSNCALNPLGVSRPDWLLISANGAVGWVPEK